MHCLLFLGMNSVRLFSLAGLPLLSAFWEVPYFAAPVPEKQHLTQHLGPIQNRHPPVGKTTCDTEAKGNNPIGTNRNEHGNIIVDFKNLGFDYCRLNCGITKRNPRNKKIFF